MTGLLAWSGYALVISALLTVAALLAERSAREAQRPGRWIWVVAMVLSAVLPVLAVLPAGNADTGVTAPLMLGYQPIVVDALAARSSSAAVLTLLPVVWLALSLLCVVALAVAAVRLTRARRAWRSARIDGVDVLVSDDLGPAVVGVRSPRIVMPEWVFGIETGLRRMLLLHELEHVRARDVRLLAGALALLVALPWNPLLWWQFLRLRLAIEVDCDSRVVRAGRDARGYGALLLEVGRRRSEPALAVAFGEPHRFLEHRIRMLPRALGRQRSGRAFALALPAAAALLLAVCARDPMTSVDPLERAGRDGALQPAQSIDAIADGPTFTPFTVHPELKNRSEVARALGQNYPPLLREAGIGGEATIWFLIDETGSVVRTQIEKSTDREELDAAALRVADVMQFTPALNQDKPVPVWVQIPIVFRSNGEAEARARAAGSENDVEDRSRARMERLQAQRGQGTPEYRSQESGGYPRTANPAAGVRAVADGPQFTPFTVHPELKNRAEVARALESNYPAGLRAAGIGGEVIVWVLIDETGEVQRFQLNRSSGYNELDAAALRVAASMSYTPALNRDKPVPVWVQIPIVFTSRSRPDRTADSPPSI